MWQRLQVSTSTENKNTVIKQSKVCSLYYFYNIQISNKLSNIIHIRRKMDLILELLLPRYYGPTFAE